MANEITEQEEVKCSFCGKPQSQVKKIVAGNGVYICNECIDLSKKIIDDELKADSIKGTKDLPKPMEIKKQLDEYVIGQDRAKRFFQLPFITTINVLVKWILIVLELSCKNQTLL